MGPLVRVLAAWLAKVRAAAGQRGARRNGTRRGATPLPPVTWSRRGPQGGSLYILAARDWTVALDLSEDAVLQLAEGLRRDPGGSAVEVEVDRGWCVQKAHIPRRALPWALAVVNAVAQEIRYARERSLPG